jgi:hypothetical protein
LVTKTADRDSIVLACMANTAMGVERAAAGSTFDRIPHTHTSLHLPPCLMTNAELQCRQDAESARAKQPIVNMTKSTPLHMGKNDHYILYAWCRITMNPFTLNNTNCIYRGFNIQLLIRQWGDVHFVGTYGRLQCSTATCFIIYNSMERLSQETYLN